MENVIFIDERDSEKKMNEELESSRVKPVEIDEKYKDMQCKFDKEYRENIGLRKRVQELSEDTQNMSTFLSKRGLQEEYMQYLEERRMEAERIRQEELLRKQKEREHDQILSTYCATSDADLARQMSLIDRARMEMKRRRGQQ